MRLDNNSCKKIISIVTLTLYVCFLIVAVFHNHVYDSKSNIIISDVSGNNNKIKDPFLDDQSNCRLVQFLYSYYSTSSLNSKDLSVLPVVKNINLTSSIEFYDSPKIFSHFLRAPPQLKYSA